jgi:hypothetical protein
MNWRGFTIYSKKKPGIHSAFFKRFKGGKMYGDKVSEKRSFLMVAAVIKETDSYDPYVLYPYICDIIDKSYKGKKGGRKDSRE